MDNLIIINDAKVDEAFIVDIFNKGYIKKPKIILRLLDGYLPYNADAIILARSLREYAKNFRVFDNYLEINWDFGIAISKKYCLIYKAYPAYFAYLLGHELGHANICADDISLHVFYCLIQEHIKTASNGEVSSWHVLPHEVKFDQFGLYIAEALFGREKIDNEIKSLLDDESRDDSEILSLMLMLKGTTDLSNLRDELVAFAKPYRTELIESWEKSIDVYGKESLASYFDDLNALFF